MQSTKKLLVMVMVVAAFTAGCETLTQLQSLLNTTETTTESSEVPNSVGAAIAALFSGPGVAAQQVPNANVQSVCLEFDANSDAEGPDGIDTSNTIEAGTYGPSGFSVTLDGTEDCQDDDTNALAFASFEIMEEVVATCDDGATVSLMPGSTGVYRINDAEGYNPEIYGTFKVKDNDGTVYEGVRCQILLGENGEVLAANCEDADGNTIDTDSDSVSCQFD